MKNTLTLTNNNSVLVVVVIIYIIYLFIRSRRLKIEIIISQRHKTFLRRWPIIVQMLYKYVMYAGRQIYMKFRRPNFHVNYAAMCHINTMWQ